RPACWGRWRAVQFGFLPVTVVKESAIAVDDLVDIPVYPLKGYSLTIPIAQEDGAHKQPRCLACRWAVSPGLNAILPTHRYFRIDAISVVLRSD
ncbi:hypothetical protein, partial [Klebsiella pneumoniae]|uniref:hypothetical protein n=1 Tax=Klebsiella pneumoniae TaxID=573 RepID=UPI00210C727F